MPRYYFDLYQGAQRISEDASGYECPSDEDARQFARMSNGLVALDPVLSSPSQNHRVVVLNEDGQSIFTMSVSQAAFSTAASSDVSLLS
ncbi:hypothetical protein BB934_28585 (plasmid) [Microvirga ossetica]|uniref:DUF6894 domain-containing protein n=1 Tax=Microvirga ossetica TaxID=1882682 RepID=A0A1B2EQL8_9HYPH|nr:hypothetical protein [Microvirga ossetica]ANY82283.1 hypothetical protein BB934_28585 [Microvirga ossetica]